MLKPFLKKIKEQLEREKSAIEKELESFAKKNKKLKGDWNTKFPTFNGDGGGQSLEDEADKVEEYLTRLPIEYNLETRLKDIDLALEKIRKGKYGKCEKCAKKIPQERLIVFPEAKFCLKCKNSKK